MTCASHLLKWEEKNISKKSVVVGQKSFISRRGCIMEQDYFLRKVKAIFGENRILHNYSTNK